MDKVYKSKPVKRKIEWEPIPKEVLNNKEYEDIDFSKGWIAIFEDENNDYLVVTYPTRKGMTHALLEHYQDTILYANDVTLFGTYFNGEAVYVNIELTLETNALALESNS